jgi:hypothetical protein
MKIPPNLENLLGDCEFKGVTQTFCAAVEHILNDNKLPFFPNYTDHGGKHVEAVLKTVVRLIPKAVWDKGILSPDDALLLITSCLLHDLALHLHPEGFVQLVSAESKFTPVPWFDREQNRNQADAPWPAIWHSFISGAKRWNESTIADVIGNDTNVDFHGSILYETEKDTHLWTETDKLIIGEFIRQHHARLAHEIAIYGFPGSTVDFPILADKLGRLGNLCGLVARSHGIELRHCTEYLEYAHSGDRRPLNTVPIYHMCLLRIADYLQMDASRAPRILLHLRSPQSLASLREWEKHSAIDSLSFENTDPQAIKIDVNSNHKLATHLQIRELIVGLQIELDKCSAVLSEFYGRMTDESLNLLQLAKSRVRSNVDDAEFRKSLGFVPEFTQFAADPHILTLLVEPLYGQFPEVGFRELLQNSIDAVRERIEFCDKFSIDLGTLDFPNQPADVVAKVICENGNYYLQMVDTGMGMDESVIRHYFLRAGASFRNSSAWVKLFTDEEGKARVLRSGRFGIGIFSSFLLGPEISVQTRRVGSGADSGYEFVANATTNLISLNRVSVPMGTTVTVRITREIAVELEESWDWYVLNDPSVRFYPNEDSSRFCAPKYLLPSSHECQLPNEWFRIRPFQYDELHWTFARVPPITCNGIRISRPTRDEADENHEFKDFFGEDVDQCNATYSWKNARAMRGVRTPCVSVFDSESNFPLTLDRYSMTTNHLPFESELLQDIALNYAAFVLTLAPQQPVWNKDEFKKYYIRYPLFFNKKLHQNSDSLEFAWAFSAEGAAPFSANLSQTAESIALFYSSWSELEGDIRKQFEEYPCWISEKGSRENEVGIIGRREHLGWDTNDIASLSKSFDDLIDHVNSDVPIWGRKAVGARIAFTSGKYAKDGIRLLESRIGGKAKRYKSLVNDNNWVSELCYGAVQADPNFKRFFTRLRHSFEFNEFAIVVRIYLSRLPSAGQSDQEEESFLTNMFHEIVGVRYLPFNLESRNHVIEKATAKYPELSRHLSYWKSGNFDPTDFVDFY